VSERLPKKDMQRQKEAYDAACDQLGLPHGEVVPGKGHWKYVTRWPLADNAVLTVIIVGSPCSIEKTLKQAKTLLRQEMARQVERVEARRP
jgi:hypothetical protein